MPAINQDGEITILACESALEFVSVLEPLTGVFNQVPTLPAYIFRGVSSETHTLLPSAFRPSTRLLSGARWVQAPLPTVAEQCEAELYTLRRFFEIAARQGVRLPEDSQALRSELDDWTRRFFHASPESPAYWPPRQFYSLLALAQHYRIPTRALDWTWNPLAAAYFAARGAMGIDDAVISVWVFSYLARHVDQILQPFYPADRPLVVFNAPSADNDNLRAQQGLFMLEVQKVVGREQLFAPEAYDKLLRASLPGASDLHLATRVTLPSKYAASVIRFLSSGGVTAGTLFPGMWGVARELEDEQLLSMIRSPVDIAPHIRDLQNRMAEAFKNRGA